MSEYENFLMYQTYPFDLKGKLTVDGIGYTVYISVPAKGDITIQFIEPELLHGAVMSLSGGVAGVMYDDINITYDDAGYSAGNGVLLAAELFNLKDEDFAGVEVTEQSGVKLNVFSFANKWGSVQVYISTESSSPVMYVSNIYGHDITFNVIS